MQPIKRLVLNLTSVTAENRPAPAAKLLDKGEGAGGWLLIPPSVNHFDDAIAIPTQTTMALIAKTGLFGRKTKRRAPDI